MNMPVIRKARRLQGRTLVMRDVRSSDAAFILDLRTDERKNQHLSKVSGELADQVRWLEQYQLRANEAYFIIETMDGKALGTVRFYDARGKSFGWGSWVLSAVAPSSAAIESAMMVYAYALDTLGFEEAHFQVRRENQKVWAFHERFGAQRVAQNDLEIEYALSGAHIRASMQRYARFLPHPLIVEIEQ